MFSFVKVFLLLSVMVCISKAQFREAKQQCLCQSVRALNGTRADIKDIQIYKATNFCSKVEIVVTNKNGLRYCLDPKLKVVQRILASIMSKQRTPTARPTEYSSTAGSSTAGSSTAVSSTARI